MKEIDYLLASSVTAHFKDDQKYGLLPTIGIAKEIGADGCQLFVNLQRFDTGREKVSEVKSAVDNVSLNRNIIHLPGYLTPPDLDGETLRAAKIGVQLINPIPGFGRLCIIHHNPFDPVTPEEITAALGKFLNKVGGCEVSIGLEHYHPPAETNNRNLPEQVNKYLQTIMYLQEKSLPIVAVFDIVRFWTCNAQEPLQDKGDVLLEKMCQAVARQPVLIHAIDFKKFGLKPTDPENTVRIGLGVAADIYKRMVEIGRRYEIRWIAVVDESEIQVVKSQVGTASVKTIFR